MIITQTPLRVSLFGGGTDFPDHYKEHGGCVLTTAIDKYIYVIAKKRFDNKLRIGYTQTELVDDIDQIQHELIRESLRLTDTIQGIEIATMGDIPSEGSGLGSSSTVTVGSLHALYGLQNTLVSADELAKQACHIERDVLKAPIGIQDQYAAALGGLRFIKFLPRGLVIDQYLEIDKHAMQKLNNNLMLFFTGKTRKANDILGEYKENLGDKSGLLCAMGEIAQAAQKHLARGEINALGNLLHQSWKLKNKWQVKLAIQNLMICIKRL